jgi:hypothetical protein
MSYHVDVIGNEPLTGRQTLLARLLVENDRLVVDAGRDDATSDQMMTTLERIVPEINPTDDPEGFIAAVQERMDYTYMIASALHSDDECRFDAIGGEAVREQPEHSEQLA